MRHRASVLDAWVALVLALTSCAQAHTRDDDASADPATIDARADTSTFDAGPRDTGLRDSEPQDAGDDPFVADAWALPDPSVFEISVPYLALFERGRTYSAPSHLSVYALDPDPRLVFEQDGAPNNSTSLARGIAAPRHGGWFLTLPDYMPAVRWTVNGRHWPLPCWAGIGGSVALMQDAALLAGRDGLIGFCPYALDGEIGTRGSGQFFDVAIDEERRVAWGIQYGVDESPTSELLVSIPLDDVTAVRRFPVYEARHSLDVAADGTVWVGAFDEAARAAFVAHYDRDGLELSRVPLSTDASSVRVHPATGDVWAADTGLVRIEPDGTVHRIVTIPGGPTDVVPDHATRGVWVAYDGYVVDYVELIDVDGNAVHRIPGRSPDSLVRQLAIAVP
ncbi:MAG: hypothetical protein U0234_33045 [Sandaracinus sp.]